MRATVAAPLGVSAQPALQAGIACAVRAQRVEHRVGVGLVNGCPPESQEPACADGRRLQLEQDQLARLAEPRRPDQACGQVAARPSEGRG